MNKPVAWAIKADNDFTEIGFDDDLLEEIEQMYVMEGWKYEVIPLYTHPAELTDAELYKEAVFFADYCMNHFDRHSKADMSILYSQLTDKFKAILRKAKEK